MCPHVRWLFVRMVSALAHGSLVCVRRLVHCVVRMRRCRLVHYAAGDILQHTIVERLQQGAHRLLILEQLGLVLERLHLLDVAAMPGLATSAPT